MQRPVPLRHCFFRYSRFTLRQTPPDWHRQTNYFFASDPPPPSVEGIYKIRKSKNAQICLIINHPPPSAPRSLVKCNSNLVKSRQYQSNPNLELDSDLTGIEFGAYLIFSTLSSKLRLLQGCNNTNTTNTNTSNTNTIGIGYWCQYWYWYWVSVLGIGIGYWYFEIPRLLSTPNRFLCSGRRYLVNQCSYCIHSYIY